MPAVDSYKIFTKNQFDVLKACFDGVRLNWPIFIIGVVIISIVLLSIMNTIRLLIANRKPRLTQPDLHSFFSIDRNHIWSNSPSWRYTQPVQKLADGNTRDISMYQCELLNI